MNSYYESYSTYTQREVNRAIERARIDTERAIAEYIIDTTPSVTVALEYLEAAGLEAYVTETRKLVMKPLHYID